MEDRIALKIVTAAGVVFERRVSYVSLPTTEGSVGILPDHAPMLCAVGRGVVRCRFEGKETESIAVTQGVASVEKNELTVLVEEARIAGC